MKIVALILLIAVLLGCGGSQADTVRRDGGSLWHERK